MRGPHGVGVDNIDVKAATRRGIPVCFAPGANTESVAEHAILLMLAVGKRTSYLDREVRKGRWWDLRTLQFLELKGMSLGLMGLGRIGSRVAELALAFGMEVYGYDPYVSPEEMKRRGVTPADRDEVLRSCDIISLHLPCSLRAIGSWGQGVRGDEERGYPHQYGTGGLVDEEALYGALKSGKLFGAGLDVTDPEPLPRRIPSTSWTM